jgi:HEAT repeat protein
MGKSKYKSVLERYDALEHRIAINDADLESLLATSLLDRSPRLRWLAARAVGEKQLDKLAPNLLKLIGHKDYMTRVCAIESIGMLAVRKQVAFELVRYLRDPVELVRVVTAEAVGRIRNTNVLDELEKSLSDSSSLVRSYVADAIGGLGLEKSVKSLEKYLEKENSEEAKVGFYRALYSLGKKEYISELLNLLNSDDYHVRCAVASSIQEMTLTKKEKKMVLIKLKVALTKESTVAGRDSIERSIAEIST